LFSKTRRNAAKKTARYILVENEYAKIRCDLDPADSFIELTKGTARRSVAGGMEPASMVVSFTVRERDPIENALRLAVANAGETARAPWIG
jgi:hypothetical protein